VPKEQIIMFVAFMPLHILLCNEVLLYFVLRIEVI
jgi:hypothetical protein